MCVGWMSTRTLAQVNVGSSYAARQRRSVMSAWDSAPGIRGESEPTASSMWILGGQRWALLRLAPLTGRGLRWGVFVNGFSEDELIIKINRCGSRSIAAKEGDWAWTYSLATFTEPKFRRLQISPAASVRRLRLGFLLSQRKTGYRIRRRWT